MKIKISCFTLICCKYAQLEKNPESISRKIYMYTIYYLINSEIGYHQMHSSMSVRSISKYHHLAAFKNQYGKQNKFITGKYR